MTTRWLLVARPGADVSLHATTSPRAAAFVCPLCARAVRAFSRAMREPVALEVFACPGCDALVEEAPWQGDEVQALPGATVDELKEAVQEATREAERWRCQADIARQRKDDAWAAQAVAWSTAAEQRAAALRWQAAARAREAQ